MGLGVRIVPRRSKGSEDDHQRVVGVLRVVAVRLREVSGPPRVQNVALAAPVTYQT